MEDRVFEADEGEYVLTIALDMSGSFEAVRNERAWDFMCQIIDRYFRDRIGHDDKLILAQLSDSEKALLWKGTPLELRQQFTSGVEFRKWMESKADPSGSRLYEGIVQAVEYTDRSKGRSAIFILSDMIDSTKGGTRDKAVHALASIGKQGGVGLYYVDIKQCKLWEKLLRDAGVPEENMVIEADIVGHPTLPRFE